MEGAAHEVSGLARAAYFVRGSLTSTIPQLMRDGALVSWKTTEVAGVHAALIVAGIGHAGIHARVGETGVLPIRIESRSEAARLAVEREQPVRRVSSGSQRLAHRTGQVRAKDIG